MAERILFGKEAEAKYEEIKSNGLMLFQAIVGSTAYGTNLPTSDIDEKFVYMDSIDDILAGRGTDQINITDDYVGYEIGRYAELLAKQNPNIIELLFVDEQHITFCSDRFRETFIKNREKFLSNKVAYSFGDYAYSQVKKAQGTNKKFLNPMDKERKGLLDFCWIAKNQGSISLIEWIKEEFPNAPQWLFGASALDHMKNCFNLFLDDMAYVKYRIAGGDSLLEDIAYMSRAYKGLADEDSNSLKLSSIEKGIQPITTFYCNIEGYSKYCKDYKEYWEWIEKRNEQRFVENADNEHNYDRKNMMHCHRLLNMCIEILQGKGVQVHRKDREYLLGIRNGKSTYQELVDSANEKKALIEELHKTTLLPENCDMEAIKDTVLALRKFN